MVYIVERLARVEGSLARAAGRHRLALLAVQAVGLLVEVSILELGLAFAADETLVVVVVAVELENRDGDGFGAHVAVDHVGLDLGRRLLGRHGGLLRRFLLQLELLVRHVDFDALGAVVVLLVVFEALLVDLEQLLAHETLVVGHLHVARLAVEHALLFGQETLACDRLLARHACNVRDFLKVAQNGKVQFAWTSSILNNSIFMNSLIVFIDFIDSV